MTVPREMGYPPISLLTPQSAFVWVQVPQE